MSLDNVITPARFTAALQDLPLSSLALKVAEIRNSIAHLDYSNEQLQTFASPPPSDPPQQPDQDCVDAIRENEEVIKRMEGRIELIKHEVERRGASWQEVGFMGTTALPPNVAGTDAEAAAPTANGTLHTLDADLPGMNGVVQGAGGGPTNSGAAVTESGHSAWSDGTFQTGRIGGGRVTMDQMPPASGPTGNTAHAQAPAQASASAGSRQGGTLSDEELQRRLAEMLGDDGDAGLHL